MTAGHFGLATGLKAWAPRIPLWALLLSTYLLDVVFIVLFALGVEGLTQVNPPGTSSYGGALIHAYYTHSLLGALVIAALAGIVASRFWGGRGGWIIAGLVFSHWVLDLLVHRPDLPILPNNAGNLPLLGLGLWQIPTLSALIELVLVIAGAVLYYRRANQLPTPVGGDSGAHRRQVLTASLVTGALLLVLLATDVLGL